MRVSVLVSYSKQHTQYYSSCSWDLFFGETQRIQQPCLVQSAAECGSYRRRYRCRSVRPFFPSTPLPSSRAPDTDCHSFQTRKRSAAANLTIIGPKVVGGEVGRPGTTPSAGASAAAKTSSGSSCSSSAKASNATTTVSSSVASPSASRGGGERGSSGGGSGSTSSSRVYGSSSFRGVNLNGNRWLARISQASAKGVRFLCVCVCARARSVVMAFSSRCATDGSSAITSQQNAAQTYDMIKHARPLFEA